MRIFVLFVLIGCTGCDIIFRLDDVQSAHRPDGGIASDGRTSNGSDGGGTVTMGDAGISCDPLADNDFDGSATVLAKSGSACGSGQGCYGAPSLGTQPPTTWTCMNDVHASLNLRHRVQCTTTNGCAAPGPTYSVNSCNQGYYPLLRESTMSSTVVCLALCSPGDTYLGNPGAQAPAGKAPHRCNSSDARGTFNETGNGDHCVYSWIYELDPNGFLLPSPTSDVVGYCVDHSKYGWPACDTLSLSQAQEYGCVQSAYAILPMARTVPVGIELRPLTANNN